MKKKILLTLIIVVFIFSLVVIYLNMVVLPVKLRLFIIQNLGEQTNKKVKLESLQLNIFKGLVLRNLVIYDDKETFIKLAEGDFGFLILPFFKKQIVIPAVKLRSLTLFLERRPDKTLNIMELFTPGQINESKTPNKKFSIFIYKISVVGSRLEFKDKTLPSEFTKTFDDLNLTLQLGAPSNVKFNLKANIPDKPKTKLAAAGIYKIKEKELSSKIYLNDLVLKDLAVYYPDSGISFGEGLIDAFLGLKFKDDIFYIALESNTKTLAFSNNNINAQLSGNLKADLEYSLGERKLIFSGNADVNKLDIWGLELFDKVSEIKGKLNFNNAGLTSDKLTAQILQIPLEAKLKLTDFKNPYLDIAITSGIVKLDYLKSILEDRFKLTIPADLQGESSLSLKIESALPFLKPFPIEGYLDILKATIKIEKLDSPLENIHGRLDFTPDTLKWPDINFQYLGTNYKTQGSLTDFKAPKIQLSISSKQLSLESKFNIQDNLLTFSKFRGRYLDSDFSLQGNVGISDPALLQTDITAKVNLDLKNLDELFKKFKERIEKIKPSGIVNAEIKLKGNINDISSCSIQADLWSSSLSVYGLRSDSFSASYLQENKLIDIPSIHLSLYSGSLEGSLSMNLAREDFPYLLNANIQDVKLKELKQDTAIKNKDIAGTIKGEVKINGFSKDFSRTTGAGGIYIYDGKLWELNLLQGVGKLIFAKDFTGVVFKNAGCQFLIENKAIFTDNLKMESEFVSLDGPVKIGFDGSLDAALQVHVDESKFPLSGTFKDITTAIIGEAGKFGTIKITGTISEPKYKFKASAVDIIRSLKDRFLGQ